VNSLEIIGTGISTLFFQGPGNRHHATVLDVLLHAESESGNNIAVAPREPVQKSI